MIGIVKQRQRKSSATVDDRVITATVTSWLCDDCGAKFDAESSDDVLNMIAEHIKAHNNCDTA